VLRKGKAYLEILYEITEYVYFGCRRCCEPGREETHIDFTSSWISSTLLHSVLDQSNCFFDVLLLNFSSKAHFCDSFRYSDHGLELSRSGCDGLFCVAHIPHSFVLINKRLLSLFGKFWLTVFTSVADKLGQKVSRE
jgi:hypothetical protein